MIPDYRCIFCAVYILHSHGPLILADSFVTITVSLLLRFSYNGQAYIILAPLMAKLMQAADNTTVSTITTLLSFTTTTTVSFFLCLCEVYFFLSSLRLSIMLAFSFLFALVFAFPGGALLSSFRRPGAYVPI